MTNIIKELEALKVYVAGVSAFNVECVSYDDLRAIIEQAKAEKQEPVCFARPDDVDMKSYPDLAYNYPVTSKKFGEFSKPLYAAPLHPDIVAELVKALEDDAYAATFQSMAGYRTALIAKVKGVVG